MLYAFLYQPDKEVPKMKKTITMLLIMILTVCLSGCGRSYEYTSGDLEWYSTYSPGKMIADTYYFSDDWFSDDPSSENKELALASMQLTAAAVTDDEGGSGAAFLKSIGFDEVGFNDFADSDPDGCNYTWARKRISDGKDEYTLVAVVIQSYALDNKTKNHGWKQNFIVNDEAGEAAGEHHGFAAAADSAAKDIAGLSGSDQVKYWIMGQSRGGAIANILAERLPELLGDRNLGIFAYTFEAPATVDAGTAAEKDLKFIHNYVCSDDFVTMIPAWDMTRYGVMHDLKTKDTDEGLIDELTLLGSDAADLKPRIIVTDQTEHLSRNIEAAIPAREDYSKLRTDKWTDSDGKDHEVTYSYQAAFVKLMDIVFDENAGTDEDSPLSKLLGKRKEIMAAADDLADGIRAERSGGDAPGAFWTGTEKIYKAMEEIYGEGSVPFSSEELYTILRAAAPVLIDVPESTSEEPSTDLLVNLAGYPEEMMYSHQFDTLIARLKVLAPSPVK